MISNATTFSGEPAVLRRLLELMMTPHQVISWEQIFHSDLRSEIAVVYFLLDIESHGNVETFVTYTLGRLLRQLTRYTEQHQIEYQGQIRGRIVWSSTLKARYSQNSDPNCYVCREVRHQYDTPQNQLLKYMVEQLGNRLEMIPEVLRFGGCYTPASERHNTFKTDIRLERMEVALNNFRRHSHLRDVTLPLYIDEIHLFRTETARTAEYAELARMYRAYKAIVESPSWEQIVTIGKRVLLLPEHAGPDGEPWIQLAVNILQAKKGLQ